MHTYTLSGVLMGVGFPMSPFDAAGDADALTFGRGVIFALCELRPDFEVGARYQLDRVGPHGDHSDVDATVFIAECDIVKRDGKVGVIWRVPGPPTAANIH